MLAENLRSHAAARAVEEFDSAAIVDAGLAHGELTLSIDPARIAGVCGLLKRDLAFARLSSVTGVDRHPEEPRFEVVYHLHSLALNQRLRLKCRLPGENPEIDSVAGVWRAADWYERETFDLLGIRFRNHPDLRRILLPDDWEGHPLRKDYSITGPRI